MPIAVEEIHDKLAMELLEKHWKDAPVCMEGDKPATMRLISRCCNHPTLHCTKHYEVEREAFNACREPKCTNCGRVWYRPVTWREFMNEVPL